MTQTVATPPDTGAPQTKRADELEPSDWIAADDSETGETCRVLSAHSHGGHVLVVFEATDGEPETARIPANRVIDLASDDEIAEARSEQAQMGIANQLHELAEAVADLKLPLTIARGKVEITQQLTDIAEVASVGERLGIPVEVDTCGRNSVFWPKGSKLSLDPGVRVEWFRYDPDFKKAEPKPVTVTEMVAAREIDNADEPEPVPDFVDGNPMTGRPVSAPPAIRSDESIVDLGSCKPVMRYFSFGGGQTDPATGENLLDKYVTVVAPTAEGCREAMLASRFGREWSMEYTPGRSDTDEWIARWTEHDRIVVGALESEQDAPVGKFAEASRRARAKPHPPILLADAHAKALAEDSERTGCE